MTWWDNEREKALLTDVAIKMNWERAGLVYSIRDTAVSTLDAVLMMELSLGVSFPNWLHM